MVGAEGPGPGRGEEGGEGEGVLQSDLQQPPAGQTACRQEGRGRLLQQRRPQRYAPPAQSHNSLKLKLIYQTIDNI